MSTKTSDWFAKPLIVTVVGGLLVGIPVAVFQVKFESKPDRRSEASTSAGSLVNDTGVYASELTDEVRPLQDSVSTPNRANRPALRPSLEVQVSGFPVGYEGVDYNRLVERMLLDRLGGSAYLRGCLLVVRGHVSEGAPRVGQDYIATVEIVDWQLYSGVEDHRGTIYQSQNRTPEVHGTGPDAATAQGNAVRAAAAQMGETIIEKFGW